MATTLQNWTAQHPGVDIDGDGKWLVFKPCVNKARRFQSYFDAHRVAQSRDYCQCDDNHFIVELAVPMPPARRNFAIGYR